MDTPSVCAICNQPLRATDALVYLGAERLLMHRECAYLDPRYRTRLRGDSGVRKAPASAAPRHPEATTPDQQPTTKKQRPLVREVWCNVVGQHVRVRLRRSISFTQPSEYFVQCDQRDCQYADENKPPCPLTLDLFKDVA